LSVPTTSLQSSHVSQPTISGASMPTIQLPPIHMITGTAAVLPNAMINSVLALSRTKSIQLSIISQTYSSPDCGQVGLASSHWSHTPLLQNNRLLLDHQRLWTPIHVSTK
jgi:hypothetical protein